MPQDELHQLFTVAETWDTFDQLAKLVRKALDHRGTVTRGEIRRALEAYERVSQLSDLEPSEGGTLQA